MTGAVERVTTGADLPGTLNALAHDPLVGLIVVDERLIGGAGQDIVRDLERSWPGLLVVLPAPGIAARPQDDYALQLIRRAIGYQVRVNL
jgi:hypothetical protein